MNKSYTTEEFIEKVKNIHGDKYNYSKVNYINNKTLINIICLEHGDFLQTPRSHFYQKSGCPKCVGKFRTTESLIDDFIKIHFDKYNYSNVIFINNKTKVKIICLEHGEFLQTPNNHLSGKGCPKCVGKNKNTEDFIIESKKIHSDTFDYSLTKYNGSHKKIKIICNKHGEFSQTPTNHLAGQGCPICKESNGEKTIRQYLENNKIKYIKDKKFKKCKDKYVLPFDFYLPDYNICIEFDGIQHFEIIEFFGGLKALNIQKEHDDIKTKYCLDNNIELLRIRYDQDILSSLNFIINL